MKKNYESDQYEGNNDFHKLFFICKSFDIEESSCVSSGDWLVIGIIDIPFDEARHRWNLIPSLFDRCDCHHILWRIPFSSPISEDMSRFVCSHHSWLLASHLFTIPQSIVHFYLFVVFGRFDTPDMSPWWYFITEYDDITLLRHFSSVDTLIQILIESIIFIRPSVQCLAPWIPESPDRCSKYILTHTFGKVGTFSTIKTIMVIKSIVLFLHHLFEFRVKHKFMFLIKLL